MKTQPKTLFAVAVTLAVAGALATPFAASAEDAPQTRTAPPLPAAFKTILDNEHVRVFESTFAPGVVVPMRMYPRRTIYVLKGPSQMKLTDADGKTEVMTQEAGSVRSAGPGKQSVANVGTNEVVVLVTIDKRDMPAQR